MTDILHVLDETKINSRICPRPEVWQKIYDLLPDKTYKFGMHRPVAMPAFPSDCCVSWYFLQLKLDFKEHLYWGSEHGVIEEIYEIIHTMPESSWFHHGDHL